MKLILRMVILLAVWINLNAFEVRNNQESSSKALSLVQAIKKIEDKLNNLPIELKMSEARSNEYSTLLKAVKINIRKDLMIMEKYGKGDNPNFNKLIENVYFPQKIHQKLKASKQKVTDVLNKITLMYKNLVNDQKDIDDYKHMLDVLKYQHDIEMNYKL